MNLGFEEFLLNWMYIVFTLIAIKTKNADFE